VDEIQLKELIKDYIKNNLTISVTTNRGHFPYGMGDTTKVEVLLEGEVISYDYLQE